MKLAARGWAYSGDNGQFLTPIAASSASGAPTAPPSPERHILLFFGGFGEREIDVSPGPEMRPRPRRFVGVPGTDMTRRDEHGNPRTSAIAYDDISRPFAEKHSWNPALDNRTNNPAVDVGLGFLRQRLSLQGKLVIYGFSAGGFNALRLCERIAGDPDMGGLQVDLLITVDPCLQDVIGHMNFDTRTPKPLVVEHLNYYQTIGGYNGGYIGRRMPNAQELSQQLTVPPREPRSPHDAMPTHTLSKVKTEISTILRG